MPGKIMEKRLRGWGRASRFGLILLASAMAAQTPVWKGKIFKEGDVTVIQNPKEPIYKGNILSLKEELSIGGASAEESNILAEVDSLAVDEEGTIYALDTKDICVKVYDRTGKFLRLIGRKGAGPGEFMSPSRVLIDGKNRNLLVQDVRIGFVVYDFQGKFIKNMGTTEMRSAHNVVFDPHGNLILNRINIQDETHRRDELKKYGPDLSLLAEIKSIPLGSPYDVTAPIVAWDLDNAGNIVFGFPSRYEIEIISDQNQTIKRIQKESDPEKLTVEEKERIARIIRSEHLPADIADKMFASKYHSAFRDIHIGGDDRIFVSTWKKSGKNNISDVFDKDGRFLSEVVLPSRRVFFARGRLYTIEEDVDGYPVIKRYAMTWKQ
jgi:hypothetical protein